MHARDITEKPVIFERKTNTDVRTTYIIIIQTLYDGPNILATIGNKRRGGRLIKKNQKNYSWKEQTSDRTGTTTLESTYDRE